MEDRRLLAVVTVDTELDVVDFDDGVTSLREAIFAMNIVPGPDEIVFDFGHDGPATLVLEQGELEITEALSISGDGPDLLAIDAQERSRIFNITAQAGDYTIAGMTLTEGRTTRDNTNFHDNTFSGGAIRSLTTGSLTIQNCAVSGSSTTGRWTSGGGVLAEGDVTVTSSTIAGNSARHGGGISAAGNVTVTDSTISGNRADYGEGGGIYGVGDVTVTSSTISGNAAFGDGGGISAAGNVAVTNSTISGNSTGGLFGYGGGIDARSDVTVTIESSIVAGNTSRRTTPTFAPAAAGWPRDTA